ncbi:hypothetical protein EI171_40785 [Bradyrhizobium sp. LCT2]|nr:hypothetical protein EI171_40785 [Bradyrhizobium sp. LCT2]
MSPRGAGIKVCSGGITGMGERVEGDLGMLVLPNRHSSGMASSMCRLVALRSALGRDMHPNRRLVFRAAANNGWHRLRPASPARVRSSYKCVARR